MKQLPSVDILLYWFLYKAEEGCLYWNQPKRGITFGRKVGTVKNNGYLQVQLSNTFYYVHRIIWKIETGEEPPFDIDHRNRIRNDNLFSNLRSATRSQNLANTGLSVRNTSGIKGVYKNTQIDKWTAQICVNQKVVVIGSYKTITEAADARRSYAIGVFGEFAI